MNDLVAKRSWSSFKDNEQQTYGEATCPECGALFTRQHASSLYCSTVCKRRRDNRAKKPKQRRAPEWEACRGFDCKNVFRKRQHNHRFCSTQCGQRWHAVMNRKTPVLAACPSCQTEFLPRRSQKYCSKQCWRDDYYDRLRRKKRTCGECGAKFIPGLRKKFCSNRCMNEFDLKRKRERYRADSKPALEKAAAWRERNREYLRKTSAAYRATHPEEVRERSRRYYAEHGEELKAKRRADYARKKEQQRVPAA